MDNVPLSNSERMALVSMLGVYLHQDAPQEFTDCSVSPPVVVTTEDLILKFMGVTPKNTNENSPRLTD